MKKSIAVLYGGRSGEHEVSLVSAASVARNLDAARYDVRLIGIAKDGGWYLQDDAELARCREGATALSISMNGNRRVAVIPGGGVAAGLAIGNAGADAVGGRLPTGKGSDLSSLKSPDRPLLPLRTDAVFPVLHGTFGEDGTVQGLLEMAGLPYIGGGVLGSAIGMDKEIAKALWLHAGLPTVPYVALRRSDWAVRDKRTAIMEKAERDFRYPLFVKPSCAGSSVGAGIAADREELERRTEAAFKWDDKILIEPFVRAREVECSVTGNDKPEAYTPGEISPTHEFYDYEAKYLDPDGAALLIPAGLEETQLRTVREIAVKAYRVAELSGLARVDFFVRKDTGEILLNEVNTMPGFTTISMFPKMCEASGLAYGPLLDRLVALAEERHAARSARDYSRASAPETGA